MIIGKYFIFKIPKDFRDDEEMKKFTHDAIIDMYFTSGLTYSLSQESMIRELHDDLILRRARENQILPLKQIGKKIKRKR